MKCKKCIDGELIADLMLLSCNTLFVDPSKNFCQACDCPEGILLIKKRKIEAMLESRIPKEPVLPTYDDFIKISEELNHTKQVDYIIYTQLSQLFRGTKP